MLGEVGFSGKVTILDPSTLPHLAKNSNTHGACHHSPARECIPSGHHSHGDTETTSTIGNPPNHSPALPNNHSNNTTKKKKIIRFLNVRVSSGAHLPVDAEEPRVSVAPFPETQET